MRQKFITKSIRFFVTKCDSFITKCASAIITKRKTLTDNPVNEIYVSKIENRTLFKIRIEYILELLIPETMKLLESADKNDN